MVSLAIFMVILYRVGLSGVHSSGDGTLKVNADPLVPLAVALASVEPNSWTVISYGMFVRLVLL